MESLLADLFLCLPPPQNCMTQDEHVFFPKSKVLRSKAQHLDTPRLLFLYWPMNADICPNDERNDISSPHEFSEIASHHEQASL